MGYNINLYLFCMFSAISDLFVFVCFTNLHHSSYWFLQLESCLYIFLNCNISVWLNTCQQRSEMVSMCLVTVVSKICFYSFKSSWFSCFILYYCKLIDHTNIGPILYLYSSHILFENDLTSYHMHFWTTSWKWDKILQQVVILLVFPPSILRQFIKFAEINGYINCKKEYFNLWMQGIKKKVACQPQLFAGMLLYLPSDRDSWNLPCHTYNYSNIPML
jgi:hypothetical protein